MNIVVTMKQIPDLQQIRIRDRQPVLEEVPVTFGYIDKNALEAAVVLKETVEGRVIAVSAGSQEVEDTVKEALAAGADEAVIVADDCLANIDSAISAQLLALMIEKIGKPDLILCGEGSGDNYSGQVGSRIAARLNLPQVGYASQIEINGNTARVTRSLEDGDEVIEVQLPALITVQAGINEPRIPSVTQILKAGKKPRKVIELDELGVELPLQPIINTLSNLAPITERKQIKVKSAEELVKALQADGLAGR